MKTSDFYYDLPEELIAQDPLADRSSSRLMHLDAVTGKITHDTFKNVINYLEPGDTLVINDTKVIPARLYGVRAGTLGKVEILLLVRKSADTWECLVKPGKKCKVGTRILFGSPDGAEETCPLIGEITDIVDEGNRLIKFSFDGIFEEVLDSLGEMPLPPYIHHKLEDRTRYNTVYAEHDGSAAAPTAGLHFTKELLMDIENKGINIAHVTLHVGLGTFRPVKVDDVNNHHMHSEYYIVPEETARIVNETKSSGHRVICVGTTSCRTIESAAEKSKDGSWILAPKSGWTQIFIYPGYEFKLMQGLITNFHLPESTLVMLVSAFAGREHVLTAYEEAVREKYRFFSFGDAMILI
ncbi:MAG: tRNA preQ1(34) S-adenosylmethionine ribosyltransferase-isomerase QueA [Lachnospiraceae bacterium]|jgi:S-adenosylmethionine:tRNA ribosyltransferase-isomerase|nr:tRNA preQ1(34) S-adenosylmethionine ribosyltransferase-isomerase QueA [Lachnospiraceae bacterium]MBR3278114.1 tRNA preQ1(34) S-adenosylmethionine ribosyltransferase-isomerase QueA [Lachnospiraceae bacterium]